MCNTSLFAVSLNCIGVRYGIQCPVNASVFHVGQHNSRLPASWERGLVTPLWLKISNSLPCWELSQQLTKYPPGSDSGSLGHKVAILSQDSLPTLSLVAVSGSTVLHRTDKLSENGTGNLSIVV